MIDDAETVEDGARLECELCIVGAGAAGITLALRFLRAGLRVILLESGGLAPDPATQALYEGEVADAALHSPTDTYRQRRFGGSTTVWGGRCVPYDPIDFRARPWVAHSGWPIAYGDVAAWYPAANAICEAGEFEYSAQKALPGGMKPMIRSFVPEEFTADGIERFSCPTDFGNRYRHRLERSAAVRVLLRANAVGLRTGADGTAVEAVEARTLSGRRFAVAARRVVLATGGLEIPRLLLAARGGPVHAEGIGNAGGLVGRFYMCHVAGTLGALKLHVPRDYVWNGYEVAEDGTYCRRRLALTDAAQERHGIAAAVIRLHFPSIPDPSHRSGPLSALYLAKPFISYEYSKRLHGRGGQGAGTWLRHAGNLAREPFGTAGFLLNWVRRRTLSARKFPSVIVPSHGNLFSLDFHGEQVPNPDSRVTLGAGTDALGLPRLRVDWRHDTLDMRTAEVTLALLDRELRRWGRGTLDYEPGEVAHHMLRDGAYGGHHIGTARMGTTPATGVVDTDCRVHGMRNLFLAGAAVFPTSSQANPTLTIVALALRLADHLAKEAAKEAAKEGTAPSAPALTAAVAVQEGVGPGA